MTEEPQREIKRRGPRHVSPLRTPDGAWTTSMVAVVLGTNKETLGRWLNGLRYPEVRMMKRIEHLFNWDCAEQVKLIPMLGYDLRYSMVLRQVMEDWKVNNPRTLPSGKLRSAFPESPRGNYSHGQYGRWARAKAQEEASGDSVTKITQDSK